MSLVGRLALYAATIAPTVHWNDRSASGERDMRDYPWLCAKCSHPAYNHETAEGNIGRCRYWRCRCRKWTYSGPSAPGKRAPVA